MQIRQATVDDIDDIVAFKLGLVATSWSDDPAFLDAYPDYPARLRERAAELLADPHHRYWMATEDGQAIGCMSASISKHLPGPDWPGIGASLSDLYVAPEHRGQGVAKALMADAMRWCREQHAWGVELHATRMARPMYEKLGWRRREVESADAMFVSMFWHFDQD